MNQYAYVANIDQLDTKIQQLQQHVRAETDKTFHVDFWQNIRQEFSCFHDTTCEQPKNPILPFKITQKHKETNVIDKLSLFLPIHPHRLSIELNIDQHIVLTELLYATTIEMLQMHWAIECRQCFQINSFAKTLQQTPDSVQCQKCGKNNPIHSLDQMIALFFFSTKILQVKPAFVPQKNKDFSFVTANTLINHSAFDIFRDQVVPHDAQPFAASEVFLVFTDIVGSTNMYAHLGDREALRLVRQYFDILFSAMASRGRIVKTIGDAIMASFSSATIAMAAVAEAFHFLSKECTNPHTGNPLEMRVGIHCGSSIVISVNGINDYFGQTVNIASRIESHSNASVCLMSEAILHDDETKAFFQEITALPNYEAIPFHLLQLKGVSSPLSVGGFRYIHNPQQSKK